MQAISYKESYKENPEIKKNIENGYTKKIPNFMKNIRKELPRTEIKF